MLASRKGHHEVASVLLEAGAAPNAKSLLGLTALHFAALHNRLDVVKLLVRKGHSDVECRSFQGATALMFAATVKGEPDVLRYASNYFQVLLLHLTH